jgi:hypothetical protein
MTWQGLNDVHKINEHPAAGRRPDDPGTMIGRAHLGRTWARSVTGVGTYGE